MFGHMWSCSLIGLTFILSKMGDGRKCPVIDTDRLNLTKFIECPSLNDPVNYTECCKGQCCSESIIVYEIDDRLIMKVGISVICTCFILVVAVILCCFWSQCPMYNMCRGNYLQGDIIADSKEDDPTNSVMPPEEKDGQNYYSPNVTVRLVDDV